MGGSANWGVLSWMAVLLGLIIIWAGADIWFRKPKPCSCKCCKSCEEPPCCGEPPPQPRKRLKLKAFFHNSLTIISIQGYDMSIVARNDQQITFNPIFEDEHGNVVTLDTIPTWSLSNDDVAALEVSEDGLQAVVTPKGPTGLVQLNVLIDADPGQGVEPLVGVADITVVGGKIKVIRLAGLVTDKVAVVPEPELPVEPEPEPEPEVPGEEVPPVEEPTPEEPQPEEPAPVEPTPEEPAPTNPEAGTIIRATCVGFDKYYVLADGNGGEYQELPEANSGDCASNA